MAGDLMDEKYNDRFILRGEHSDYIEGLIQQWALLHTRQEITEFGQSNHHPWGPAATPGEILETSSYGPGASLPGLNRPAAGHPCIPGRSVPPGRVPLAAATDGPAPGEHNVEVLCGLLGLSPQELERLSVNYPTVIPRRRESIGAMNLNNGHQQPGLALKGIRVLDFTWIHAGPSATRILSDQGAEVIKVESNNALSVVGGPASATARGLGQRHNWNAGKLSISLNMKTPRPSTCPAVGDGVRRGGGKLQRAGDAVMGP